MDCLCLPSGGLFNLAFSNLLRNYFEGTCPHFFERVDIWFEGDNQYKIIGLKKKWFLEYAYLLGRITVQTSSEHVNLINKVTFRVNGTPVNWQNIINDLKKHFPKLEIDGPNFIHNDVFEI